MTLAWLAMAGWADNDKCIIRGTISNTPTDSLLMLRISADFNKQEKEDTIATNNGTFSYIINSSTCRTVYVMAKPKQGERIRGYIRLITLPGEEIVINGTIDSYELSGGAFYNELNKVIKETSQLGNAQKNEWYASFIDQHPRSQVAGYLLGLIYNNDMKQRYQLLATDVREGPLKPFIDSRIAYTEKQAAIKANRQNIEKGKKASDFTLKTPDNTSLSLADFRGKYVVLDFWGSWCGWCVKGFPDMKKYYAKYADKMEIIGVDCNDTEQKWLAAIERHQLPWKHVYVPRNNHSVVEAYAVEVFPTKIVISPEGYIVRIFAGETPTFYQFLDELLR